MNKNITKEYYLFAYSALDKSLESFKGTNQAINYILNNKPEQKILDTLLPIVNQYTTITSDIYIDDRCYYTINTLRMPKAVCKEIIKLAKRIKKEKLEAIKQQKHLEQEIIDKNIKELRQL